MEFRAITIDQAEEVIRKQVDPKGYIKRADEAKSRIHDKKVVGASNKEKVKKLITTTDPHEWVGWIDEEGTIWMPSVNKDFTRKHPREVLEIEPIVKDEWLAMDLFDMEDLPQ